MAAGPKLWTEERISERYAEGRGQGSGDNYIPWAWVQEFASRANQTRIPSLRLKRTIHTFSYLERDLYLWHEYRGFRDYREQVPMDRRITLGAAEVMGIRHPRYMQTGVPFVMMLDAVVIRDGRNGTQHVEAWDAKPKFRLANPRIREKLSLHKAFCAYIGMKHSFFTEDTVSRVVLKNIEWARGALPLEGELESIPELFTKEASRFQGWLRAKHRRAPVRELCQTWDGAHGFEPGTALRLFKFLVWHKRLRVDLNRPDLTAIALPLQPDMEDVHGDSFVHQ